MKGLRCRSAIWLNACLHELTGACCILLTSNLSASSSLAIMCAADCARISASGATSCDTKTMSPVVAKRNTAGRHRDAGLLALKAPGVQGFNKQGCEHYVIMLPLPSGAPMCPNVTSPHGQPTTNPHHERLSQQIPSTHATRPCRRDRAEVCTHAMTIITEDPGQSTAVLADIADVVASKARGNPAHVTVPSHCCKAAT